MVLICQIACMGPLREFCFEGKMILWVFPVVVSIYAVQIFSSFRKICTEVEMTDL